MFLYFVPNVTKDTFRKSAAFRPLIAILRDALDELKTKELNIGPAGTDGDGTRIPGLLICALPAEEASPRALRFEPEQQTWVDCGGYWLGFTAGAPPHPETLARTKQLDGYSYTLGDGREYLCPIIRRMIYQPMVPCGLHWNGESFDRVVKAEYEDLWEQSASWSKAMTANGRAQAALTCLQLNYRVGPFELEALGTFADEQAASDVILAALDEQFFVDCVNDPKKKASVETMLDALEQCAASYEDCCLDTAPVAENSTSLEPVTSADPVMGG